MAEETLTRKGIAIVNPYGGIWSTEIFETPEAARRHLVGFMPNNDISKFRLAHAEQTIKLLRAPGELLLFDIPTR